MYQVQPIEDGWFAIIYLPTGNRTECFRRKSDATRRFNRYYGTYNRPALSAADIAARTASYPKAREG